MELALEHVERPCKREICRWNDADDLSDIPSVFDDGYEPSTEEPIVFHLHGSYQIPRSMVLTESDYLEFLIKFATEATFLPPPIRKALAGTSLMFVGYSLNDYNFRVLFRGINGSITRNLQYGCVAVQLPPEGRSKKERAAAQEYIHHYLERIHNVKVQVYWGDATNFMGELMDRWRDSR
jgi:hypothetical protein